MLNKNLYDPLFTDDHLTNFPAKERSRYEYTIQEFKKRYPESKKDFLIIDQAFDRDGVFLPGYHALHYFPNEENPSLDAFWAIYCQAQKS